ncbi:MAG: diguanylate cyclase [Chloroflexota bacterium]|nr:diguanylate cyclase [Chloroflexota bacterium]
MARNRQSSEAQVKPDPARVMSALLPVHSANTLDWLVDATSTAAEGALNAAYALVYIQDQQGRLERKSPASDLRRRSLQRAIDAFGKDVLDRRIDPTDAPHIAEALDAPSPALTSAAVLLRGLGAEDAAIAAQRALGVSSLALVPLKWAGERFGALLLMFAGQPDTAGLQLFADHVACATVNLRQMQSARASGATDVSRAVFDARKLESELQKELARAARHKHGVSLVVIEATNLRLLRERFGDILTDQLLERLGTALAENARDIDVIGAYKESGYTMILTQAPPDGARIAVERLLAIAEDMKVTSDGAPGLELHLACGWATSPDDGATAHAMFGAAERRMYYAAEEVA